MASLAKKRKMNFSEREVEIIVEEIERHKHALVNHFNAGVTHLAKNGAWQDILRKVNAVTTCPRELAEVKKKWSDMKTEVRRKVAQARAAMEGGGGGAGGAPAVPVILTAMQQRICNLLGEATIISLPADALQDHDEAMMHHGLPGATVTLTQALPTGQVSVCDEAKQLNDTEAYLEEVPGVVEYCTTTVGGDPVVEATPTVDMLGGGASAGSPPPLPNQSQAKPQELKSRIALNSARLLQEQRVTNVHVRQIAVHLEGLNEMLQAMRRSQEAQAYAQERQAQALEGTQAALLALVQMLRPALKDLRKSLQSGGGSSDLANASASANANASASANASVSAGAGSAAAPAGSGANNAVSEGGETPPPAPPPTQQEEETQ